ncbi:MAG: NUDIX hydrolase [Eubacterium sp.]|nr:NUDIX hydrolase [Eubacterium sp.]
MEKAVSCGGVVIFRGKILLLYKNCRNRYEGWVLPKGTVEAGETHEQTALREVREETGVKAKIIEYVGKSEYSFNIPRNVVEKEVHWYLMSAENYFSRPQREEFFVHSGYYRYIEAIHLLKFPNEKMILKKAYQKYLELNKKDMRK